MPNHNRTSVSARVKERWAEYLLAAVIFSACVLAVVWVFRVPLLQNPDETSHIDYAFSIYSAGRLLNVRTPPSEWNVHPEFGGRKDRAGVESTPYDLLSHQFTLYLIDATEFHRIRFHPDEKVSGDYGTSAYYRRVDDNAPKTPARVPDLQPQDNPWLVTAYPFLYYAVVAVVQKLISIFADGPVWLFLGARLLSVAFFAASLVLAYALLRQLRLRKGSALMLTAIVAFFPLTIFVSSSVQPDNLTMFLVLLCSYCALLLKRREQNVKLQLLLALALGALLVTKYHVFLFTAFAVLGTVITEHIYRKRPVSLLLRKSALILLPSVLLFVVQLWIVWGAGRITGSNLHSSRTSLPGAIKAAIWDYYRGGPAWISWWGTFGWMDAYLVIWSPTVQAGVWRVLSVFTLLALVLAGWRILSVTIRLLMLLRRRGWRITSRIAFSDPLIVGYFCFSIFMVLLYALTDNSFFAQGRHWLPYTVPGFLMALLYAPRVFKRSRTKRIVSTTMMAGLLIYCAVAGYFSLKTITDRYYSSITSNVRQ